jgi:hypothetical protein
MLPESSWNSPFITIEESRKELQYKKFLLLSDLWDAPFNQELTSSPAEAWNEIFNHQNASLKKAMDEASSVSSFYNQLQNTCWQYGRSLAEKDWPTALIQHPHEAFLAISTLKVGILKNSECYLLERKTQNACNFYWLSSPIDFTELCMLYHEVFRGYFYHLSRNLRVEIHSSILPNSDEKVKSWKFNLLWID